MLYTIRYLLLLIQGSGYTYNKAYTFHILTLNWFGTAEIQAPRITRRARGLITVLFDGDNEQPLQEFSCVFFLQTLEAYEGKKIALFPRWHFSDILMWSVSGELGQKSSINVRIKNPQRRVSSISVRSPGPKKKIKNPDDHPESIRGN